ncbi:MAG: hypothetical protein AAF557_15880 [Pseudomonadota bacterium]
MVFAYGVTALILALGATAFLSIVFMEPTPLEFVKMWLLMTWWGALCATSPYVLLRGALFFSKNEKLLHAALAGAICGILALILLFLFMNDFSSDDALTFVIVAALGAAGGAMCRIFEAWFGVEHRSAN